MASNVLVSVDMKALMKEITVSNGRIMTNKIRQEIIDPKIKEQQDRLIKDFASHSVTRELKNGPNGSSISGAVSTGNLYSFIGFSGGDPTAVIENIFNRKIEYKVQATGYTGTYKITLKIPTIDEVFQATPMPWATSSWAEGVEKGISNLGSYLFRDTGLNTSRSGTGIQTKNKISSVRFSTTPYITNLINEFKKGLTKI